MLVETILLEFVCSSAGHNLNIKTVQKKKVS